LGGSAIEGDHVSDFDPGPPREDFEMTDSAERRVGRVKDKVAIVTGAGSKPGMGWSTAHLLAAEGATVLCTDVHADAAEACAAEICSAGGLAVSARHDVTSAPDWEEAIRIAMTLFGRLDILVNNAGIQLARFIEDLTIADFRMVYRTNCEGPFLGIKAALPHMREGIGGSIVNVVSIATRLTTPGAVAYSAAKGGLLGMSKAVAVECAPYGIRCNTVHPGTIWTNMFMRSAGASTRESMPWSNAVPLGQIGDAEDIAKAVLYLASDDARYVTGAELFVDGGLTTALNLGGDRRN
jgi:3alpha(or 20beta)-hydroxysteroid dehydrogenase